MGRAWTTRIGQQWRSTTLRLRQPALVRSSIATMTIENSELQLRTAPRSFVWRWPLWSVVSGQRQSVPDVAYGHYRHASTVGLYTSDMAPIVKSHCLELQTVLLMAVVYMPVINNLHFLHYYFFVTELKITECIIYYLSTVHSITSRPSSMRVGDIRWPLRYLSSPLCSILWHLL